MAMLNNLCKIYLESFRLAYVGYGYHYLRQIHSSYNSQIDTNALYDAKNFRKAVLSTHHYPRKINQQPLLRKQDFKIEGNKLLIIYKPRNRLTLSIFPSEKQLVEIQNNITKGARVVKKENRVFLNLVLEKEISLPRWEECETIIGVDIGINYLAVCSALNRNGKFSNPIFFHGGEWKHLCDRKRKIECHKEEFKHLTRRQHEILHTISKRIVEYAKSFSKPIIVLEKLSKFKNDSLNKRYNFLLGNWARRKLQFMIEYKAKWEGIPVVYINPAYTSQYCHYCGAKGERENKTFKCPKCGRTYNADANASMNLAKKFRQLLDERKQMIEERSPVDLSSTGEGETRLPCQTHVQPRNGMQMNRMKLRKTVSIPVGVGGD
jgi:IS605 OrfB family transposase